VDTPARWAPHPGDPDLAYFEWRRGAEALECPLTFAGFARDIHSHLVFNRVDGHGSLGRLADLSVIGVVSW
jgi:hypothetical protein